MGYAPRTAVERDREGETETENTEGVRKEGSFLSSFLKG
jgi:hypothetical protein